METENPQTNSPESPQTAGGADKPELNERVGIVEAILFVTGNAVEKSEICRAMNLTEEELEETLNVLEGGYDYDRRGLRLLRFGRHVQLATRPDYAKYVEKLLQPVQKQSLSQAVMEALGGLPPVKVHCSLLAEQAVHAALWDYAQKNHITIEGLKPPVNDVDELEEAHKDEA